ncbi:MAG: site-specific integrase [Clostridia bacterium]|nr:site-specific integrase [Clostridia bacterium]
MRKRNFNGEGTVYYSESKNCWIGQYTKPNGTRSSVYAKTNTECKKKLKEKIREIEDGMYCEGSKLTIYQLGKNMLDTKFKANLISETSYKREGESLKKIKEIGLGDIRITDANRIIIQEKVNDLRTLANSYITKVFRKISLIFEEAIIREIIVKNPMIGVLKPRSEKEDKKVRALTVKEHRAFVNALENEKYKNIFLIDINTGMRIGEILALKPENIDFENNVIHVRTTLSKDLNDRPKLNNDKTKTYAGIRDIPFDEKTKRILKDSISKMTLNKHGVIFSEKNELIHPNTINTVFKRICTNLGIPLRKGNTTLSTHSLRHTFATRCVEAGIANPVLQKIIGHKDIQVTINTYTDILEPYRDSEFKKIIKYKASQNI